MNHDNRTHHDADHNTQTEDDDWENADLENYGEALDRLPTAVIHGVFLCSTFEDFTQGYFSWDAIPALQIYEAAGTLTHMKDYLSWLLDGRLSKEDLLSGIEIYKSIKSTATAWALTLARDFEAAKDNFAATSGGTFDVDVDRFVAAVACEDDDLEHIRETDPLLYGEICTETNRLMDARQQI